MANETPALPPGFQMEAPAPPEGFVLQGTQQRSATARMLQGGAPETTLSGEASQVYDKLLHIDRNFDSVTGVPHAKFRAGFSFMDTDQERQTYLNDAVGKEGWTKDSYGAWALTPAGMEKLGLKSEGKPVLIEERGLTPYDLADIAGSLPSIAGGIAGGTMGAATGVPVLAIGGAGLGAGLARGATEGIEQLLGVNQQPLRDVIDLAHNDALAAMGGEVLGQAGGAMARRLLAPEARRMTPEHIKVRDEALGLGVRPRPGQVTGAPILSRVESMMNMIFKDPMLERNSLALGKEMERMANAAGPRVVKGRVSVGENIKEGISTTRKVLGDWASTTVNAIQQRFIPPDAPDVIPTGSLKAAAKEILADLPHTAAKAPQAITTPSLAGPVQTGMTPGAAGRPILTPQDTLGSIAQIAQLPPTVTLPQMQAITNRLYDAIGDDTIVQGISGRNARLLWSASTKSYDDIADPELRTALTTFRTKYRDQIQKFDNALVRRITQDPSKAGALDPEDVLGAVFKRGKSSAIRKIKAVTPPEQFGTLRRQAMEELLGTVTKRTTDPFNVILDGKAFLTSLDSYGKDTLNAMFGPQLTDDMYRFGRVTQLMTKESGKSGALVAAHIALHPWANLPKLAQLRVIQKFMTSETGLRWLTDGLRMHKTRAGADALARVALQVGALSDQELGGPVVP